MGLRNITHLRKCCESRVQVSSASEVAVLICSRRHTRRRRRLFSAAQHKETHDHGGAHTFNIRSSQLNACRVLGVHGRRDTDLHAISQVRDRHATAEHENQRGHSRCAHNQPFNEQPASTNSLPNLVLRVQTCQCRSRGTSPRDPRDDGGWCMDFLPNLQHATSAKQHGGHSIANVTGSDHGDKNDINAHTNSRGTSEPHETKAAQMDCQAAWRNPVEQIFTQNEMSTFVQHQQRGRDAQLDKTNHRAQRDNSHACRCHIQKTIRLDVLALSTTFFSRVETFLKRQHDRGSRAAPQLCPRRQSRRRGMVRSTVRTCKKVVCTAFHVRVYQSEDDQYRDCL